GHSGADRFTGVSSPLMTWTGAQNYCRTLHTDLASALTQADSDMLQQVVFSQGESWIGLFRDTWKWVDGSSATNLPWRSGLPNNFYLKDNCGALDAQVFSDQTCSNRYDFVCDT
ncbi:macrophage mannose receptor 1-like isoform X6, partial [Clarias magur]